MKLQVAFLALIFGILFISGCTQDAQSGGTSISDLAKAECIKFCQDAFNRGQELSKGPCLSDNNPEWQASGWVCDIAHSPRQEADNDPANQCLEFREGRASHFVELDPDCEFIKAV